MYKEKPFKISRENFIGIPKSYNFREPNYLLTFDKLGETQSIEIQNFNMLIGKAYKKHNITWYTEGIVIFNSNLRYIGCRVLGWLYIDDAFRNMGIGTELVIEFFLSFPKHLIERQNKLCETYYTVNGLKTYEKAYKVMKDRGMIE